MIPASDQTRLRETQPAWGQLPGDLMMWILILSELLVFGAGLASFMAARIFDPAGFAAAQDILHRSAAGWNTIVLVTSGYLAAIAAQKIDGGKLAQARYALAAAAGLGLVFLAVKFWEYAENAALGIGADTHPFFTFYYLLTGFHAAHVIAGIVILALVARFPSPQHAATGVAFWHMVDLVWVLLFPVLYLLR